MMYKNSHIDTFGVISSKPEEDMFLSDGREFGGCSGGEGIPGPSPVSDLFRISI